MAPIYCVKGRRGGAVRVAASKERGTTSELGECRRAAAVRKISATKALLGKLGRHWIRSAEASFSQQRQRLPSQSGNRKVGEKGREKWPSYAAVYAAIAGIAVSLPLYANAVSEENLLYLEAWRAVYQAYYDGTYNGQNWFKVSTGTRAVEHSEKCHSFN